MALNTGGFSLSALPLAPSGVGNLGQSLSYTEAAAAQKAGMDLTQAYISAITGRQAKKAKTGDEAEIAANEIVRDTAQSKISAQNETNKATTANVGAQQGATTRALLAGATNQEIAAEIAQRTKEDEIRKAAEVAKQTVLRTGLDEQKLEQEKVDTEFKRPLSEARLGTDQATMQEAQAKASVARPLAEATLEGAQLTNQGRQVENEYRPKILAQNISTGEAQLASMGLDRQSKELSLQMQKEFYEEYKKQGGQADAAMDKDGLPRPFVYVPDGSGRISRVPNPERQIAVEDRRRDMQTQETAVRAAQKEITTLLPANSVSGKAAVELLPTVNSINDVIKNVKTNSDLAKRPTPIAALEAGRRVSDKELDQVAEEFPEIAGDRDALAKQAIDRRYDAAKAAELQTQEAAELKLAMDRGKERFKELPKETQERIISIPETAKEMSVLDGHLKSFWKLSKANGADPGSITAAANAWATLIDASQAQPGQVWGGLAVGLKQQLASTIQDPALRESFSQLVDSFGKITNEERNRLFGATLTNNEMAVSGMTIGNISRLLTDENYGNQFVSNWRRRADQTLDSLAPGVRDYAASIAPEVKERVSTQDPAATASAPAAPAPRPLSDYTQNIEAAIRNPNAPGAAKFLENLAAKGYGAEIESARKRLAPATSAAPTPTTGKGKPLNELLGIQ